MKSKLIYIILLNWNGWKDTITCIESCRNLIGHEFRILVIDNGSTDGSEAILRDRFPDMELIQTGKNLGFAGGNNVGIRYALEHGADFVWLLNNDTIVAPNSLSALICVVENDKHVGMVGSKINFYDNPQCLWYAGAVLDPEMPYRSSHRGIMEEDRGQYEETGETGYITGCSLLARREMIEGVGLLDEKLFLYYEDTDWNARAKQAGWKVIYAPSSVVMHKVSSSIGGAESPRMRYYLARNLLFFIHKNYPRSFARAFWFDLFENVIVQVKKGHFSAAIWALKGIIDYLRQKSGPKT
jgi:GT2 family glycosyltransferase